MTLGPAEEKGLHYVLRYHLMSILIVVVVHGCTMYALWYGKGPDRGPFQPWFLLGNAFAWKVVVADLLWCLLSLYTGKKLYAPKTDYGQIPVYRGGGISFFVASIIAYLLLHIPYPDLSHWIYDDMISIVGAFHTFGTILCIVLFIKGKVAPDYNEEIAPYPWFHEFYRGIEHYPSFLGVNLKQWITCRVSSIAYGIIPFACLIVSFSKYGYNSGFTVNFLLQTIFGAKFYAWEHIYVTRTLDFTMDRAGYYMVCGSLTYIPGLTLYSSYFFVAFPPGVSNTFAWLLFAMGIVFQLLEYIMDGQKTLFQDTNGDCLINGKPAKYIKTEYDTPEGKKTGKLLISGFWGKARHFHYLFNNLYCLCANLVGYHHGIFPFSYNIFNTIFHTHRLYRDDEKCLKKYGRDWEKYCKIVPYRMIPGVF